MLRGITTARSVARTMAGSTMKCSVVSRTRSSRCAICRMRKVSACVRTATNSSSRRRSINGARAAAAPGERVALAQQHHVAVLDQLDPLRLLDRWQEAEREVDAAAVQRVGDLLARQRHGLEAHARRPLAQRGHQRRQETPFADVAHVDAKDLARAQRIEAGRFVERLFQCAQCTAHGLGQPVGLRRGLHAARCAHEQRILQQQPQPRQAMAGGRLGEFERLGGAADVALPVDGIEQAQQVEIDVLEVQGDEGQCPPDSRGGGRPAIRTADAPGNAPGRASRRRPEDRPHPPSRRRRRPRAGRP